MRVLMWNFKIQLEKFGALKGKKKFVESLFFINFSVYNPMNFFTATVPSNFDIK